MNNSPGLTLSIPLFFTSEEKIDYSSLEAYIHRVSEYKNIAAVYSMAYNTRYRMLDFNEVIEVNSFILKKSAEVGLTCYVGHPYIVNRKSFTLYLEKIAKLDPAGISMLYPERFYGMAEPILEFLSLPSKFGLNTVIHEMKFVSGFNGELVDWPEELIEAALDLDKVVAIKEDSKSDKITEVVLRKCLSKNIACVLAGGGKRRALKFIPLGLNTWLNGTTMFLPHLIDKIYPAMLDQDTRLVDFYCSNIEKPFFDNIASKYGWHLSHKAALEYFGFGGRAERFPHPMIQLREYKDLLKQFQELQTQAELFLDL